MDMDAPAYVPINPIVSMISGKEEVQFVIISEKQKKKNKISCF